MSYAYEVGCLCFQNETRKASMRSRFEQLQIPHRLFSEFPYIETHRALLENTTDAHTKRVRSCMLNHLSIIHEYYMNSSYPYIVVCEDDVLFHKRFKEHMPYILDQMRLFDLDILLLGCLLPHKHSLPCFQPYSQDLWGTQAYAISRRYAKELLERFYFPSELKIEGVTFAADWVITKYSEKRAYIYPLLCVEEGMSGDGNDLHQRFHSYCTELHKTEEFI